MKIDEITATLNKHFNPYSIVLYGSRARTDFLERSDYEIGLFYSQESPVGWEEINQRVNEKGVNIYPFCYEDFLNGTFDTPFQKTIFKRELIATGKTLSGINIQELPIPQIKILDIIEDNRFYSARALDALISLRNNDTISASLAFYKSCLFSTRDLIMLKQGEFPYTYDEIAELSKQLDNPYNGLVEKAYKLRQTRGNLEARTLIENVTYINTFIEPLLKDAYEKNKDMVVVY